jgi:hypothetical protein
MCHTKNFPAANRLFKGFRKEVVGIGFLRAVENCAGGKRMNRRRQKKFLMSLRSHNAAHSRKNFSRWRVLIVRGSKTSSGFSRPSVRRKSLSIQEKITVVPLAAPARFADNNESFRAQLILFHRPLEKNSLKQTKQCGERFLKIIRAHFARARAPPKRA